MVKGWAAGEPGSREEYRDPSGQLVKCEPGDQWLTARRHYLRVMTLKDAKTLKEEYNRNRPPGECKTDQTILGCMFAEVGDTEQYPMGMTPKQYKNLVHCAVCKHKKCDTRTHIYRNSRANAEAVYGDRHRWRVVCNDCKKMLGARVPSPRDALDHDGAEHVRNHARMDSIVRASCGIAILHPSFRSTVENVSVLQSYSRQIWTVASARASK